MSSSSGRGRSDLASIELTAVRSSNPLKMLLQFRAHRRVGRHHVGEDVVRGWVVAQVHAVRMAFDLENVRRAYGGVIPDRKVIGTRLVKTEVHEALRDRDVFDRVNVVTDVSIRH